MNTDDDAKLQAATRRRFLKQALGTGACLGLGSLASACSPGSPADPASPADPDPADGAVPSPPTAPPSAAPSAPPTAPPSSTPSPDSGLGVEAAGMPYRQDDPVWAEDLMWDRDLVIEAAVDLNGETQADAEELLREFDDGNTIANEGCMLTSMAMVLRLLLPDARPRWTPRSLNKTAQDLYYYTLSGLSLTTLYADLVSEVSNGQIQLCLKEEYLPGTASWPKMFANTSALVRAYRSLAPAQRADFLIMLKTGTYDDTVASHYVLLHPDDMGTPDSDDPQILDPAMPMEATGVWRLSDSAAWITGDPDIAAGWAESDIRPTQIGGVWVFTRWRAQHDRSRLAPLIRAWADELAAAGV